MTREEFDKKFLSDTDETGRHVVYSPRTGIKYYVEPLLEGKRVQWGDVDPATKNTTGDYGSKYIGAVRSRDSLITEENGLKNIKELEPGASPYSYIDHIDELRYAQGFRPK